MLSLFQEEVATPISENERLIQVRQQLQHALDKGNLPKKELLIQDHETHLIKWWQLIVEHQWPLLTQTESCFEIIAHGPQLIERLSNGPSEMAEVPISAEDWQLSLEVLAWKGYATFNVRHPFASFYLAIHGTSFRVTLIHSSTSPQGISKAFFRLLRQQAFAVTQFGSLADLLVNWVKQKKNILVAGSTGSGKTSLLTSLIATIPNEEHILLLEDTCEIFCKHPRLTRLLADEKNEEKTLKQYLTYGMRMTPDRIILGEMRSHEVVPFLLAMNTGHRGLMASLHASSAYDALHRVAQLFCLYSGRADMSYSQVLKMLCRNVDGVVFLENKKIKEVIEVRGCEGDHPLYEEISS